MITNGVETTLEYNAFYLKEDIKNFIKNCKYRLRFRFSRAKEKNILFMVCDPKRKNPGLADRFKAMISLYNMAKLNGYRFKFYWKDPFPLSDYLQPKADFEAKWEDLEYSIFDTRILTERNWSEISELTPNKQYHCYLFAGNSLSREFSNTGLKWSELFHELFRASDALEMAYHKTGAQPGQYISVHLRFVNALEKFETTYFDNHLDAQEDRQKLIDKCKKGISRIQKENEGIPIYVFSDSKTFLNSIRDLSVLTLDSNNISHSGNSSDKDGALKSFLDLCMMARGKAVYRISTEGLYNWSEYGMVAAHIGNIPFINYKI